MTTHRSLVRRAALMTVAASTALVLAACGSNDSSSGHSGHNSGGSSPSASASASAGAHNAADVSFAQGMIPHHRQAVEMADLAATRAASAEVEMLASEIKKAQEPEIKTLSGWLTSWGEQVPAEGGMDHSGHAGVGMMTEEDMTQLEKASGAAFDTAFLKLMIKHHEGAVAMAKTEKSEGTSPDAKKLADAIIATQSAEITRMNALLAK
ncbi:DUF305 domain-containing protein [Streptomyces sp. NPDC008141]|uniref:DUF305 domain-containing protein n=1 Tax=Streptomyces sp. NPDC008141 TaxID=3364815 RepID=UPI0036E511B9